MEAEVHEHEDDDEVLCVARFLTEHRIRSYDSQQTTKTPQTTTTHFSMRVNR